MRLALILIIGAIAILATYAWSNYAPSSAQNKVEYQSKLKEQSKIVSQIKTERAILPASSLAETTTVTTTNYKLDSHATPLDVARIQARSTAGHDPFSPLTPPETKIEVRSESTKSSTGNGMSVPPPPPGVLNPFGTSGGGSAMPGQLSSGLDLGELPMPPDNAGLNHKIELVGIVGDHAIFVIKDNLLRRRNHWPKNFTLATGQSFEAMKLVSIKDEGVVVEEDGQSFSKQMPVK